jgi:hypothetical protein
MAEIVTSNSEVVSDQECTATVCIKKMLGFTETGYYERVEHLSKAKACCSYLVCNYDTFAVQSNVCLGLAGASFLGIRCTVHCYMHGSGSAGSALD